jgi:excisionase family DNA binding protein
MSELENRLELLTISELSQILRVKRSRVYGLIRGGMIPPVRLGRQIRVRPEVLEELLAKGGQPLPGGWRRETAKRDSFS